MIKKLLIIIVLVFLGAMAWNLFVTPDASTEALLTSIAESEELKTWLEEHPAEKLVGDARDTIAKTFPILEPVLYLDNLNHVLKTSGLEIIQDYVDKGTPAAMEKAETLGDFIKMLAPDLTAEVDAVLGQEN